MWIKEQGSRAQWLAAVLSTAAFLAPQAVQAAHIGKEVAIPQHLQDGDEFQVSLADLLQYGKRLFEAVWTSDEGAGRPLTKGTGNPLSNLSLPLLFPRNFNRISAPDANACSGCHNAPFGIAGGGGDIVANVFVLGQRFDFSTFARGDRIPTCGSVDERGVRVTEQTIANSRNTLGMFGSGFIEMLARQITDELQAIRDGIPPGGSAALVSKGIAFGTLRRRNSGSWDTSRVEGIAAPSLLTSGAASPPSLIIRPFHQAGNVVSLRQFTVNAYNHHHGMQAAERFGVGVDNDGDGFVTELTRADITAVTLYQATLAVPGRVIPNDPEIEDAVLEGEIVFSQIGCADCHIPSLPLKRRGWIYSEPNPYNPAGNLQPGQAPTYVVDLTSSELPSPRLAVEGSVVHVPAFTDLKLHDITSGPGDPNIEALDMNQPAGSEGFFAGNAKFLTRKLWGSANEPPYYHHGQYTTLRQAVLAHHGEAERAGDAFRNLSDREQDEVIEFLKSLQVLRPGATSRIVDERGNPKSWPGYR